MPTKPNKAGQEQNYVPAGQGDASGEYADNESGSNIHFTNFKKPEEEIKVESKEETPTPTPAKVVEEEKPKISKLNINDTISSNMKRDYANYLDYDLSRESIRKRLAEKLLNGQYGYFQRNEEDKSKTFADYEPLIEDWMTENEPQEYFYKKGGKWVSTRNEYLANYIKERTKVYTKQEYEQKLSLDAEKNLKQTDYDVKITEHFGKDCQVAFGKGYSKEYMNQIVESSQIISTDFPDMKGFIKGIGDRNSLRKLSEARAVTLIKDENYVNNLAKEIMEKEPNISFERAKEKAKDEIENSILKISNAGGRTLAFWQPSQKCLIMLPKTAKDSDGENQKQYFNSNWHSSDKPMATYYHEFGHAIDSMIADKYQKLINKNRDNRENRLRLMELKTNFNNDIEQLSRQNYSKEYNEKYLSLINQKLNTNYKSIDEFNQNYSREKYIASTEAREEMKGATIKKYNISEYGNTNTQEFVAECFSAYYTKMNNPLANKVVERFFKFYKDLGE